MKKQSLTLSGLVVAMFAFPVVAEPASFKQLSIYDRDSSHGGAIVQVVKTAGMEKYGPYSGRFIDMSADTEIAVFEETADQDQGYRKAVRSDRIPSM